MQDAPRILHWAKLVNEIEEISNDSMTYIVQGDNIKNGLVNAKRVLTSIHATYWADKDIGYPNTVEIMRKWRSEAYDIPEPIPMLRNMRIMVQSIRLDMEAVKEAIAVKAEQEARAHESTE